MQINRLIINNLVVFSVFLCGCQTKEKPKEEPIDSTSTMAQMPLCGVSSYNNFIVTTTTPQLRKGIGNSHIAISTQSKLAQQWFDQGLNLLHGFWHIEAYRVFKEVIKADSACAMGYWGMAMCQPGFAGENNAEWQEHIDKAVRLSAKASPFEKALINTSVVLIKQGPDGALASFRDLVKQHANNPEALAWAGIMMRQSNNDPNGPVGDEIKNMLEKGMSQFPDYTALMHYYEHIMELRPDFAKATPVANRMIKLAPNSPHLAHMPGHTHYLAGNYQKAIEAFYEAKKQEEVYHKTEKIPYIANQNYMHNVHFLAVAEAELGHFDKAFVAAQQYATITLSATPTAQANQLLLLYEGRILPALVCIRYRKWSNAIEELNLWLNKADMPIANNLVRTYLQTMLAYCNGMKAIENDEVPKAQQSLTQVSQLLQTFTQLGTPLQGRMEFKSINETYDIMNMAQLELQGWIENSNKNAPINTNSLNEALNLEKAIHYDEPPRLMYPIAESIGRLHLKRGEKQDAQAAFAAALIKKPKSVVILSLLDK